MNSSMPIEDYVLSTLSFYEAMTFSRIILDFNSDDLKNYPDFDKEMLTDILMLLLKKKLIKQVKIEKEIGWIRIHKTKSWIKKLRTFFK